MHLIFCNDEERLINNGRVLFPSMQDVDFVVNSVGNRRVGNVAVPIHRYGILHQRITES